MFLQIFFLIIILLISLTFGLGPYVFKKRYENPFKKSNTKIIGLSNSFSGGIFLSIAFFHILPESTKGFYEYFLLNNSQYKDFPLQYLGAFFAYSLILFIEKIAFESHSLIEHDHTYDTYQNEVSEEKETKGKIRLRGENDNDDHILLENISPLHRKIKPVFEYNHNEERGISEKDKKRQSKTGNVIELYDNIKEKDGNNMNNHNDCQDINHCFENIIDMKNEISQFKGEENRHHEHINSDEEEEMVKNIISNKGQYMAFMQVRNLKDILNKYKYHDVSSPLLMRKKIKTDVSLLKASNILSKTYKNDIYKEECIDIVKKTCEKGASHTHDHQFTPKSNLTPYILLTALSLHGLFEGIALGLQKDFKATIFLGLAILSHKWAESFTLGISFYKINTDDRLYIKLILLYSVFTPLGILIGVLLSSSNLFLESLFLSLSAGTFIYISASELIIEEFSVSKYKYEKFCFYLLGAFIIGGMSFLEIKLNVDT